MGGWSTDRRAIPPARSGVFYRVGRASGIGHSRVPIQISRESGCSRFVRFCWRRETALSQFMQWLLTSHVRRDHKHSGSSGHIRQECFKSFPVQCDEHLITALRTLCRSRCAPAVDIVASGSGCDLKSRRPGRIRARFESRSEHKINHFFSSMIGSSRFCDKRKRDTAGYRRKGSHGQRQSTF